MQKISFGHKKRSVDVIPESYEDCEYISKKYIDKDET